jgi:hypothetical protein
LDKFKVTFKDDFFDITVEGESGSGIVVEYLKRKEEIESALKSRASGKPANIGRKKVGKTKLSIRKSLPIEALSLANLSIPNEIKRAFVNRKDSLSNWDTTFLLLHYYPNGLTNKQLRSLSEELGKPISYSWLDTGFHRRDDEGLVMSKRIPGQREVIYFLTELGRKEVETLIQTLQAQ